MAGLKSYLQRDWLLLGIAMLLAVLVWKYANDELTETQIVTARLDLTVPEGLTVVGGAPTAVKLVVRGTRRRLAVLAAGGLTARCGELPAKGGRVQIKLADKDFTLPEGVEIVRLPEAFDLDLEQLLSKPFPVRVRVIGKPAPPFALLRALTEPAQVEATGKQERFEELSRQGVTHIETDGVDIGEKAQSFNVYAKLNPPRGIQVLEPVKVYVDIGVEPVNREVTGVEVKSLSAPGFDLKVKIENPLIALSLRGDPRVLNSLDPKGILAMADIAGLTKPGAYQVPVRLVLPPGVQLAPGAVAPKVGVQLLER